MRERNSWELMGILVLMLLLGPFALAQSTDFENDLTRKRNCESGCRSIGDWERLAATQKQCAGSKPPQRADPLKRKPGWEACTCWAMA